MADDLYPSDLYPRGTVLYFSYGPRDARKQVSTRFRVGQEGQAKEFRRLYLERLEAERDVLRSLDAGAAPTGRVTVALWIEHWIELRR
jgi:hypothetical protein